MRPIPATYSSQRYGVSEPTPDPMHKSWEKWAEEARGLPCTSCEQRASCESECRRFRHYVSAGLR